MDAFDFVDTQKERPVRDRSLMIWNILTIVVLVGVLCVAVGFLIIFINPQSGINPFPPSTQVRPMVFPTITPTTKPLLPPTWTPLPTQEPTLTSTPRPTSTLIPTETPYGMASSTPEAEATITPGGMSFVVQQGSPQAISNIYDLGAGCNWMGVGGQAVDMSGAPVVGLLVQLGGTFEGRVFEQQLSMTGTALQLGRGGFIFHIADKPAVSKGTLWVQLLDQQNLPLSDKIYFDTYDDCGKNLIIIFFQQVK